MDIEKILQQMTPEEKADFCSGSDFWHTQPVERLGVPAVMMSDGPSGLRKQDEQGDHLGINESIPAVCFPSSAAVASSFDTALAEKLGNTLGNECRAENLALLLGPGLNIKRSPLCGRNFEYFSEDPYLSGEMGAALVKGIQSNGVGSCIKHFAANNQETDRMVSDSVMDERTLHEIYLPAFETVVKKAQPLGVMAAYNKLNGTHCSENKELLTDILRKRWGYEGMVVTDWGAVKDRAKGIAAGQDLEMPGGSGRGTNSILSAIKAGTLSEEELNAAEATLSSIQQEIATLQGKMDRELASLDEQEKDELAALDKELSVAREAISEEIARKKAELEERKSGYDREQLDSLTASGGDPKRLEEIHSRLAYIGGEIKYINETKALIIEYLKDKREMLDKVPDWTAESLRLQQIIHGEREELKKRLADVNRSIFKVDAELKELKESNRKALENREEYHRSTLLDWFTSRESIFSSMNRTDTDGDCRSLVREITICVSEQSQKLSELRKEITAYTGNFSEDNVFAFKTSFSDDKEYMDFACDLKEFIDEDKVSEYQSRINTRNSDIFRQITSDTKSMVSQEGNIRGVVDQINADFKEKNFVGIIQCIEMRIDPSQNKIVNLLKEIKRFNEEYSWDLGQNLFASSADDTATREKATMLLRELIKSMDAYSGNLIRLADFFDLKFRVIENRNDTGFVERLTNVGSEGTDILVKSMVNIMLLNVFKRNASTVFSDFRLHCMMDEIGKLHPNNVAGILKFANDRDILLINGSPTEQDALSYKHIYKLEKDGDSFTRIRRVITQFD